MALNNEQYLATLGHGDHLCLIYDDLEQQMAGLVSYIKQGLEKGERCTYICDDRSISEVSKALVRSGIDVEKEARGGALCFLTKHDVYPRTGEFTPNAMFQFWVQKIDEALALGFAGLRIAAEMTWALGNEPGSERLVEYEAMLNEFFSDKKALAICQFNRSRFDPTVIRQIIRNHPVVVVGSEVYPNLYYEPPRLSLEQSMVNEQVDWMLAQLQHARDADRETAMQHEILANISRIITSSSNIEDVYQRFVAEVSNLLDFDGMAINLINYEDNTFTHISSVDVPDRRPAEVYSLEGTATAEVARMRSGRIFQSEDLSQLARDFTGLAPLIASGFRSFCVVPLISHGEAIGSIGFHTRKVNAYTERDRLLAEQVALQIVGAVANSQLYTERERSSALLEKQKGLLEEESRRIEVLNRIGASLVSELDLQKAVQAATDAATELTGAQFGAFFFNMVNEDGESYLMYTLSGAPHEAFKNFPQPRNSVLFKDTFEGKGIVRLGDVAKDPRYGKNPPYYGMPRGHLPVKSYLAVPVVSRSGEVQGGLFLGHTEGDRFTARHEGFAAGIAGWASICIDNARLYQRIEEQATDLQTLLDSVTEGVVEATADLKVSKVNAHALKVLGVSEENILGQPVKEVFRQPDREGREPVDLDALVREAIHSERTHKIEEAWLELGSGKAIPIALTIAPEEVEYSGQHRAVLIFDDMSSSHEVNELRNNIISVVSHELRTPLHYIKSYSSSLLQTDVEWDDDSRLDMIRTIDKGADRLTKLVNDLLEISRLQSGKIPMELATIYPDALVNEAVEQIRPLISDHKLAVAAIPGLPEVVADQSRVHQVILNLVQNASKYSPPGNTIYVGTSSDEEYIRFSVKDEGIGIASEFLDKIFDKFTRLDTIRFSETPGVGLGLAISKAIVEAHGGKLWAYSEGEGKGTTFHFTLPIAKSATPAAADPRTQSI